MELLIPFSIIMMMLSLISERTANFAKIHFQGKKIIIPYLHLDKGENLKLYLSVKLSILAYEQPTEAMEKEREYRIQVINIIIGILIAAFANANFFDIVQQLRNSSGTTAVTISGWQIDQLKEEHYWGMLYLITFIWSVSLILFNRLQETEEKVSQKFVRFPFIFWIIFTLILLLLSSDSSTFNKACASILCHTIGYIFTGLFLSLGSKFWHDFLDILLKLKNTQQTLSDPKTFTNYNTADKLLSLAGTSHSEIAQKLYDQYSMEIDKIKGVLTHGLVTIQDERTKLFKRIIEVEFSTPLAQTELKALAARGSIVIDLNTFYLQDYLSLRYSEKVTALNSALENPVSCYAYNSNSSNTFGSFWVYEKDGKYFAVSNLHVFADANEFKKFEKNQSAQIHKLKVTFVMENVTHPDQGTIIQYNFGTANGYGFDLCICSITKAVFDKYNELINTNHLRNATAGRMRMFGAISKYKDLKSDQEYTMCNVSYEGFKNTVSLKLLKLKTVDQLNVQSGDSGSVIHFKTINNSITEYFTGVLVASSDNYAYMFRFYS